jgi:hypothetical protein
MLMTIYMSVRANVFLFLWQHATSGYSIKQIEMRVTQSTRFFCLSLHISRCMYVCMYVGVCIYTERISWTWSVATSCVMAHYVFICQEIHLAAVIIYEQTHVHTEGDVTNAAKCCCHECCLVWRAFGFKCNEPSMRTYGQTHNPCCLTAFMCLCRILPAPRTSSSLQNQPLILSGRAWPYPWVTEMILPPLTR